MQQRPEISRRFRGIVGVFPLQAPDPNPAQPGTAARAEGLPERRIGPDIEPSIVRRVLGNARPPDQGAIDCRQRFVFRSMRARRHAIAS